ncbi:hypothetical protein ACHAXR_006274 [Thalassiosira sp. AJA248-18]
MRLISLTLNSFLAVRLLFAGSAVAFQFPKIKFVGISTNEDLNAPQIRVQNGPDDAENLRRKLENYCDVVSVDENESSKDKNVSFRWEPYLKESYEVADVVFQEVARVLRDRYNHNQHVTKEGKITRHELVLSFPSMSRPEDLDKLSAVMQSDKCKQMLGLENAFAELYPSSPSPYLRITFSTSFAKSEVTRNDQNVYDADMQSNSATATKDWVNNFLGKYRLCPYTSSVSRAAVGLSSVGVPVGGVHVRVESTSAENSEVTSYNNLLRAADLVSSFWSEVVTLMHSTQEEWATSLVVFPEYDMEFEAFFDVCDSIVEPTVMATQSTDFIGRAWFHPEYDADAVGHSKVIAGHAVPHKMVEGFMKSLDSSSGRKEDQASIGYDELVKANNRVRQTPHATINILRRSQLTAAGEYEKGLGEKRPKANSIYVRNAVRLSNVMIDRGNL